MTAIAIVGMDGRFPQAPDLEALWKLLLAGADGIAEVPAHRWPVADFYDAEGGPGKSNTRNAGFFERRRCLRSRVLRHRAQRSGGHGPAATAAAADGMAGAGGRDASTPEPRRARTPGCTSG